MGRAENKTSGIKVSDIANGTDGELITWDSSGVATTVAVGTSGQVLTSNGTGSAPTFQASGGGGGLATGSFSFANNVSVASNITGLVFDKTSIRGCEIFITTFTDSSFGNKATASTLNIITDGSTWSIVEDTKISVVSTNISFSITTAGQLQYTSPNDGGFNSGDMKWTIISASV